MPLPMPEPSAEPACLVTVLLATFNGAAFLQAQLDSLLAQTDDQWQLLWRDDGSTDETVAIMLRFAEGVAGRRECRRVLAPAGRLGPRGNFAVLMEQAPSGLVAFCDQDDVWLPEKLARGRAALAAVPAPVPALYCARQMLVNATLRPLGGSEPLQRPPGFPVALAQNLATGCTVMLNGAALALIRQAPSPVGTLHDWWCYLMVSAAGGRILLDREPVVLYRQHGGNAVGAPHGAGRRALAALRRGPEVFMGVFRLHVSALLDHRALLAEPARRALDEIQQALDGNFAARVRALRHERLRRQTWLETVLFVVWFLGGGSKGKARALPWTR